MLLLSFLLLKRSGIITVFFWRGKRVAKESENKWIKDNEKVEERARRKKKKKKKKVKEDQGRKNTELEELSLRKGLW